MQREIRYTVLKHKDIEAADLTGAELETLQEICAKVEKAMVLKDRIKSAYEKGIGYHELMRRVFPPEQYPKAWNYSSNGGPPGCAMVFGRALREMGGRRSSDNTVWLPS